jgi:hypothetical protein
MVKTMRVELTKYLKTAILKIPVNDDLDKTLFIQKMQIWASIPYHQRILRPLFFAIPDKEEKHNLIYIEDLCFSSTLEDMI